MAALVLIGGDLLVLLPRNRFAIRAWLAHRARSRPHISPGGVRRSRQSGAIRASDLLHRRAARPPIPLGLARTIAERTVHRRGVPADRRLHDRLARSFCDRAQPVALTKRSKKIIPPEKHSARPPFPGRAAPSRFVAALPVRFARPLLPVYELDSRVICQKTGDTLICSPSHSNAIA